MDDGVIAGPDFNGMDLEKSRPGLVRSCPFLRYIALDDTFAGFDAELEQFPPDSFGAPQPILLRHLLYAV